LTDVSGFCFHPCTIILTHTSPQFRGKTLPHASNLDMGHKRMRFSLVVGSATSVLPHPEERPVGRVSKDAQLDMQPYFEARELRAPHR
jgi:hypothetical protein